MVCRWFRTHVAVWKFGICRMPWRVILQVTHLLRCPLSFPGTAFDVNASKWSSLTREVSGWVGIRSRARQSPDLRMAWLFQQHPQCRMPRPKHSSDFIHISLVAPVTLTSGFAAHVANLHRISDILANSIYPGNHAACRSPPGTGCVEQAGEARILISSAGILIV
jgi:hypothetical protein